MNFLLSIATAITRLFSSPNIDPGVGSGSGAESETNSQLQSLSEEIHTILGTWVGPTFIAIGAVGAIYIIVLAVQYIKSENDSKRAEVKTRLVNCVIGVVAIVVIATLCMTIDWAGLVQMFGYASETAS